MATQGGQNDGDMASSTEWVDVAGRAWQIEFSSQRIVLRSESDVVELPARTWARDLYIAQHGTGFIVRVETFQVAVQFLLHPTQVAPLLAISAKAPMSTVPSSTQDAPDGECEPAIPLLWPKVSPLAVWALISSSLVFVPVLGLFPAIATVVLLVLHRAKVRRTRANGHSRAVCVAAFVFLIGGLCVSVLATIGLAVHMSGSPNEVMIRTDVEHSAPDVEDAASRTAEAHTQRAAILSQHFWEREHAWGMIAAGLVVVIVSLSFHECGHAITAWWLGDDFARRIGRVTLNPTAHIDPMGTVLLPLILFMLDLGVFGWARPVPVRTENLNRPRRGHILVSLAGPGSNLLLAAASLALMLGLGCAVSLAVPGAHVENFSIPAFDEPVRATGFPLAFLFGPLCTVLQLSFLVNVFLACFNLIPIPPLDGSWVLEHLFPRTLGPIYERIRPFGFLLFLALIYTGVLSYLLIPAFLIVLPGIGLLAMATGFG